MHPSVENPKSPTENIRVFIFSTLDSAEITKSTVRDLGNAGFSNLMIVCPDHELDRYRVEVSIGVDFAVDSDFDRGNRIQKQLSALAPHFTNCGRTSGWYYQQYLKFVAAKSNAKLVLILDGDTYVSPEYLRISLHDRTLSTTNENVDRYERLLDHMGMGIPCPRSFVANFGIVDPMLLVAAIPDLERWFFECVERVIDSAGKLDISEYQTFGRIMVSGGWKDKRLRIFRRGDLLVNRGATASDVISLYKTRYSVIAFENKHKRSRLRRLAALLAVSFRYSW